MTTGERIKEQQKKNENGMNKLLKDELFKVARDEYRQLLLAQSLKHEYQYSQDIEKAYGVLKKVYQLNIKNQYNNIAIPLLWH